TFTAALRRLDAGGYIVRLGKQQRKARGRQGSSRRSKRGALDAGRSGVVRARVAFGALERAGIDSTAIEAARRLAPLPETYAQTGEQVASDEDAAALRIDQSEGPKVGALKSAARIEATAGYREFLETSSLSATKADELFRLLRVPPTTDPRPLAAALRARADEL